MTTIKLGNTKENNPLLLPTDKLTTHAAVLGQTGSGKTGLLHGVVEDYIEQGIPSILVDVKGDMLNVVLQEDSAFANKMDVRLLTPGADHGESINIFHEIEDPDKISTAVSALLKMAGEDPNPMKKAHAYVSAILDKKHKEGEPCTLIDIIYAVQDPGFHHLGALDLDSAFSKKARTTLAGKLNNLLVAPSFQNWREGIALDFDDLLTNDKGKTPVVVYSVSHLVDPDEQNFALAILFEALNSWIRQQPGSNSLKYSLVVDECVGILPPHPSNPPSKKPIMLILKQARAFGLGVLLASQNPVDLDYKSMSNCQTWFIGRMQMEKDKERVINNLAANAPEDRHVLESQIGGLKSREFFFSRPTFSTTFTTKDVKATLQGPITVHEIEALYEEGKLRPKDEIAVLKQKLKLARRKLAIDDSDAVIKEVAELEQQLGGFNKEKNNYPFHLVYGHM